jgi:hypothetical protein
MNNNVFIVSELDNNLFLKPRGAMFGNEYVLLPGHHGAAIWKEKAAARFLKDLPGLITLPISKVLKKEQ